MLESSEERAGELDEKIEKVETQADEKTEELSEEFDEHRKEAEKDIEDLRTEIGEVREKAEEEPDLEIPEIDTDRIDELEVALDNIETRLDKIEEKESQETVSDLQEEFDQVKSIVMDFKWLFNDFDDLSNLKLLSKEEYEELKLDEDSQEVLEVQKLFRSLDERLENILDSTSSAEELSQLEQRIERIEDRTTDEKVQEDVRALAEKVEQQDKQIEEIRKGYTELGEMMEILLEEYRNNSFSN